MNHDKAQHQNSQARNLWGSLACAPGSYHKVTINARSLRLWAGVLLVILSGGPASGQEAESVAVRNLVPVHGERFGASLQVIRSDGRLVFRDADRERTMEKDELAFWGRFTDSQRGVQILLVDGSLLVADLLEMRDQQLVADSRVFGLMELPVSSLRGILLNPPMDRWERDRVRERIESARGVEDRLLLQRGDEISGVVKEITISSQGPNAGLPSFQFSAGGREIQLPLSEVTAVTFNPALQHAPRNAAAPILVGLQDGSLLVVEQLLGGQGEIRLQLNAATTLAAESDRFVRSATLLQPLASVQYLSDLEPLGDDNIPFLRTSRPPRADRSVLGGRLRCAGAVYAKGLGMHTTTRRAYRLDSRYERLQAELAIDALAGSGGSVIFKVYAFDDAGAWQTAYASPVVRGGQPPLPISVDIRNARAVALIVEFADRGDVLDYADWLNARVVP